MTGPVWFAFPPEVHSALLSSGPGSGPLLAAAAAWSALGAEYASTAEDLAGTLAGTQAGSWQGVTAERYAAAHAPYLAWLSESAAKSTVAATLHQTVAGAYGAALAAMPTLAELAANHATHAALVATNFFGINTIPIALNEADYVRMWIQAAETMTVYQSVAGSALAAVPATTPAPQIVVPAAEAVAVTDTVPPWQQQLADLLGQYTHNFAWPLGKALYPDGWPFDAMAFTSGISSTLGQLPGMTPVLASALAWTTFHTLVLFWPLVQAAPLSIFAAPALVPAAGALGAVGAVGAVGVVGQVETVPAAVMPAPSAAGTPAAAAPVAAEVCSCADVAVGNTPGLPNTGVLNPAAAGGGPPAGTGPGLGFGSTGCLYLVSSAGSSAQRAAASRRSRQAEDQAAEGQDAPAEAVQQRQRRMHRRRHIARQRGFGDEFMDMNVDVTPDWNGPPESAASTSASDHSAGALGFAGAAAGEGAPASGLATLTQDEFSGGPQLPMVPASWVDGGPTAG